MGKLAERLADARRTGVYRVETTEALEEAAALNRFALVRVPLEPVAADDLEALSERVLQDRSDGRVLLFSGFRASQQLRPLIADLTATAGERRAMGVRFFAVFLDPRAELSLAPLYNWQRSRPL
jgi:hypothetical protein